MTGPDAPDGFYVAVAAEADEPELVADIVYGGHQVAAVRSVAGEWVVTLYDPFGVEGFSFPLDGLRRALEDAAVRLARS